jgi:hypothetical protein
VGREIRTWLCLDGRAVRRNVDSLSSLGAARAHGGDGCRARNQLATPVQRSHSANRDDCRRDCHRNRDYSRKMNGASSNELGCEVRRTHPTPYVSQLRYTIRSRVSSANSDSPVGVTAVLRRMIRLIDLEFESVRASESLNA